MPVRVQRKRTKGWKMPPNTVAVSRPGYFGNPFEGPNAAEDYRRWIFGKMGREEFARKKRQPFVMWSDKANVKREAANLHGKNLACWCSLEQPCHADVLLELANAPTLTQEG